MLPHEFVKKKFDDYTVLVAPAFADTALEEAVSQGAISLHNSVELEKIPSSYYACVYRFSITAEPDCRFYFKQFFYRSWWDCIKHLSRPSRARRAMTAADMLLQNGFATPAVLALIERRRFGVCLSNSLVTVEIPLAKPADDFFREMLFHCPASELLSRKRNFLFQLGIFIGRLHFANISHGDLRIRNILVTQSGKNFTFFLLDNERTVRYSVLSKTCIINNLMQLNLTRVPYLTNTDRLRFFKSYLAKHPRQDRKRLVRAVIAKTSRRIRKKALAAR